MSDTLTTLISKAQAFLGDDGTIFTTTLLTGSFRQALSEFNLRSPQHAATLIDGVAEQYEYELTSMDSAAVKIIDVLLQGENNNELDTPLTFYTYSEDERLFFRLTEPVSSSDVIIVRYTVNHTINGLDSETESTTPAYQDQILVDGACYFAIITRSIARVESLNLTKDQPDNYREVASHFRRAFDLGLSDASKKSPAVGATDTRAWNDNYHTWEQ
jgi:hypothetical protein